MSSKETPFPLPAQAPEPNATTTASLPPAMEAVRSHSADEIVSMMKKTPLFMTNLDEGRDVDETENIQLEALRALQYEGTRAEIALSFKERGNEMVAGKRWKDAKEFYTKGILALRQESKHERELSGEENEAERKKEKTVEEACYVNRALCNLELQNFRSTLHDTAHTLTLSPQNPKAHYRSALALLSLHRYPEALDACTRGIALTNPSLTSTNPAKTPSAEHQAFLSLLTRTGTAQRKWEEQQGKRVAAEETKRKERGVLNAALQARQIKVRFSITKNGRGIDLDLEDAGIKLLPDPLSPRSELCFPLLLLYPLANQSDFLKSVSETSSFGDILVTVLPSSNSSSPSSSSAGAAEKPNWDQEGEYTVQGVDVFMETEKEGAEGKGMVKVGKKMTLLEALRGGKVVVWDEVVRVLVVPRRKVGGWVEEMRGREGRG